MRSSGDVHDKFGHMQTHNTNAYLDNKPWEAMRYVMDVSQDTITWTMALLQHRQPHDDMTCMLRTHAHRNSLDERTLIGYIGVRNARRHAGPRLVGAWPSRSGVCPPLCPPRSRRALRTGPQGRPWDEWEPAATRAVLNRAHCIPCCRSVDASKSTAGQPGCGHVPLAANPLVANVSGAPWALWLAAQQAQLASGLRGQTGGCQGLRLAQSGKRH